ncbi:MAG: outer membrane lipoprotein carrier protein LolA [Clostridia bacterium]
MRQCKYIILMLTLMIILCSCGKKNENTDVYTQIYEKYKDIQSYQCEMLMNISSNKTVRQYRLKQFYKAPDYYKIELLEPEEVKGLVTVYVNGNVTTMHPEINGKFTLLNFNPVDESYIFLPDFFEAYYKSEKTSVAVSKEKESKSILLKADLPSSSIYRFSQSMWIDSQSLLPEKMEIYDIKNKPVISVRFTEMELDIQLEDDIFQVD